jgi:outer membrane protein TolC
MSSVLMLCAAIAGAAELGFDEAVRMAVGETAALRISASDADLARAEARSSASWPNPTVALREEPDQAGVEASVPIDLGAIALRGAISSRLQSADLREEAGRAAVGAAAGAAWLDARRATDLAALVDQASELSASLAESAKRRVDAGEWSVDEGALVRADAARVLDRALSWSLEARNATGRMAVLLAIPAEDLSIGAWPSVPGPPPVDPARLPSVLAADLEARSALADLRAERIGLFPVVQLDGGYLFRGPVGPTWGASIEFPLFAPGIQRVRAGEATASGAQARAELAKLDGLAAARSADDELAVAEKLAAAWDIPGLDDALAAATRRYDAGELSLVDYLARRDLALEARQGAVDARWRLDRARLAAWELAGKVPSEMSQ